MLLAETKKQFTNSMEWAMKSKDFKLAAICMKFMAEFGTTEECQEFWDTANSFRRYGKTTD